MRKNRWGLFPVVGAVCILFNTACAQTPHQTNLKFIKDQQTVANTTVLLNNKQFQIPIRDLANVKFASVHFQYQFAAQFDSLLNKYAKVDAINGSVYTGLKNIDNLSDDLKMYNTIILSLTDVDLDNPALVNYIVSTQKIKNLVLVVSGSGSALAKLDAVDAPIIWTERANAVSAQYVAQAVFGGVSITQTLPRTFSPKYTAQTGSITNKTRLQYTVPEEAGINAENLAGIDKIAAEAIRERATPGCVVLVAKDGKVIFNKAYGYHTYDKVDPDKVTDIFDLASITKVGATTMEAMRLYEQGKLGLDSTIGTYIATARKSDKSDLKIRELLTHQAGLIPDVRTWEDLKPADMRPDSSADFPTKIAANLFLRKNYFRDVTWPKMLVSPLRTRGKYVYSDVSMYIVKEIEETITATPLNVYTQKNFYDPLGMQGAGFQPLYRFPKDRIIPTENDATFRKQLLVGYVHDQGAGMLAGVSGHAGLFATANDLAILYQMILNKGSYGGTQYFKPETVDLFTAKQSAVSRRGLGFDRWDPEVSKKYPSELASPETFGHTGYTGTCFWVDAKRGLVYVFLSNRVNPKVSEKLSGLSIRGRIQDVAISAIEKGLK
ncbi:serine hydrolase domain-containing protein [Mucilaginibacter myungsuensis]|uniref:Serine hydrolase n=1 Tax=Mucilaginibacter myungsuensis TaxID=649104 RepID=A0A929L063_9SPHI|nr:serine hydrolase [Mucilaginibacter myungsuensis]MBE9663827.1 serine hydrolase [Mucilaginibacter myungsuensis]MDN3598458.1 serine hydrolase [Mucilaginibacter myungsuensis]